MSTLHGQLQGGVAVCFDGEVDQRGEKPSLHGHINAYTAVLALDPCRGTRISGETLAAGRATCCQLLYRAGSRPWIRGNIPAMLRG
jgi:hypothetical protein